MCTVVKKKKKRRKAIYENVYLITTMCSNKAEKDYILGNAKFGIWGERQSLGTEEPTDEVILEEAKNGRDTGFLPQNSAPQDRTN